MSATQEFEHKAGDAPSPGDVALEAIPVEAGLPTSAPQPGPLGYAVAGSRLGLDQKRRPTFCARQFRREVTLAQVQFDLVFGLFLPLICLSADPVLFNSRGPVSLIPELRSVAYVFIGVVMFALVLWLLFRERLGAALPVAAGVLLAGSLGAATIGLIMAPISVLALLMLIGALGFTPWLTAFVCLRCGTRAWRAAARRVRGGHKARAGHRRNVARIAVVSAVATLALPVGLGLLQARVREVQLAAIESGVSARARPALAFLNVWGWALAPEQVEREYRRNPTGSRARALEQAYSRMTGVTLSTNLWLD